MKKILAAALVLVSLLMAFSAFAEEAETALPEGVVKEYRWFVNQYKTVRGRTVTYYKDVYAYNHGDWGLTPFDSTVADEYFVKDENGDWVFVYHSRSETCYNKQCGYGNNDPLYDPCRSAHVRKVHWDENGFPILNK